MSDDMPEGFRVERLKSLADIIYRIDPGDAKSAAAIANLSADEVLREYERENPQFAKEQRRRRRELKAWKRERDRLADEVQLLQTPFWVAALGVCDPGPEQDQREAASLMMRISNFLFEHEAPMAMVRDLLRVGRRLLPPEDQSP